MVIPQALETWEAQEVDEFGDPVDDTATGPQSGTYLEIHCAAWNIDDETQQNVMPWNAPNKTALQKYAFFVSDDSDPHYMAPVCIPLKLSNLSGIQNFEVNKKYNLRINMVNIRDYWNNPLMEGIEFN